MLLGIRRWRAKILFRAVPPTSSAIVVIDKLQPEPLAEDHDPRKNRRKQVVGLINLDEAATSLIN